MVLWIFGYGSLVWKAGFRYDQKIVGFIKNYRRTFNLACIDHRGTPEFPARAANLDPKEGDICWGIAYCVKDDEAAKQVLSYLKVRECEYDVEAHVDFFTEESPDKPLISEVLVFITTPDKINNKYYLGSAPLEEMASQIARATGPSGPSYEYIFCLEKALREIGHEDEDVIELAAEVRKILSSPKGSDVDHRRRAKESSNQYSMGGGGGCMHNLQSFVAPINNLNHVALASLNHMPGSPRLLKGQAQ